MTKMAMICAVAAILALPIIAEATVLGTVTVEHTGYGAKGLIKVWGGGFDGDYIFGGIYMLDKTHGTGQGNLWPDGPLGGLCIELSEWAPRNPLTYDVVMLQDSPEPTSFLGDYMGPDKAEYLRELWGRFFDPNWVGCGPFTYQQKRYAEAFAAAAWEIIYEELPDSPADWDVRFDGMPGSPLGFKCCGTDTATANKWLHELDGTGPKADLRALVYNGNQDYITEVPEPATICLLGLGSLALLHKKTKCADKRKNS